MGNYKFKLSDMMPNAWFYKLRDMSKRSNKPKSHHSKTQPLQDQKSIKTTKKNNINNNKNKKNKKNTTFPNSSSSSSSSPSTTMTSTTMASSKPLPNIHVQRSPRKSYYFTRDLTTHNSISPSENSKPTRPQKAKISSESPRRSLTRKRRSISKQSRKQKHQDEDSVWGSPPEYSSSSAEEDEYSGGKESRCDDRILFATKTTTTTKTTTESNSFLCQNEEEERETKPGPRKEEDSFVKPGLPPIATKPKKKEKAITTTTTNTINSSSNNDNYNYNCNSSINNLARKSTVSNGGSPGIRLRIHNSPRIADRRVSGLRKSSSSSKGSNSKKSGLSESFAVVKSSFDPQRDFRESMVEMIVENNIRASKDLEDLLACYLSLNSDEYHGLIIKVFKQIWFDLTNISN